MVTAGIGDATAKPLLMLSEAGTAGSRAGDAAASDCGLSGISRPIGVRDAGVSAIFMELVTTDVCLFIISSRAFVYKVPKCFFDLATISRAMIRDIA